MINIFNLFLFLFALWLLFMVGAGNISWLYVAYGVVAAGIVSIVSFRVKLIEEKSESLYLSFGFYRYFIKIYLTNFFSSIKLIISLALDSKPIEPVLYSVKFGENNRFNPGLLMVGFNMTSGLFCIGLKDRELLIHAIDEDYFKRFNLRKNCAKLNNVNDDNLV